MKLFFLSGTLAFSLLNVKAQTPAIQDQDPKAKKVLEELSKKMKSYNSFVIEYTRSLKSKDVNETQKGTAYVKGDKYKLDEGDKVIYSDTKNTWTILPKEKEVYVNPIDEKDKEESVNPTQLFNMWEKDFKYRHVKEENGVHEIHLFPMNPKKSKFHTIIMKIDANKQELSSVIIKRKEADEFTFKLNKLTPNAVSDADVKFEKAKYSGYTIID
jgi:outer membrane lipoprotein-sorting protein